MGNKLDRYKILRCVEIRWSWSSIPIKTVSKLRKTVFWKICNISETAQKIHKVFSKYAI